MDNNKNIGILTTYFCPNYGAMLQPFALKRTLENMGYDVEMLRYKQPFLYHAYNPSTGIPPFQINSFYKIKKSILYNLIIHPLKWIRYKKCQRFVYKYINPERGFALKIKDDKDFYIVGSDQVWNPENTGGFDDIYFGYFPTKPGAKKISYAASVGNLIFTSDVILYFEKALSNFDLISVREATTANIISSNTSYKNVQTTLDPTLIADTSIFEEIHQTTPYNKKYVLFYHIRYCWNFIEKIYAYARSINADLIILSEGIIDYLLRYERNNSHVKYFATAGVEDFLSLIRNAECVFTPSFHGTVFSILFHKCFYSLKLNDNENGRVCELLNELNLTDRMIDENAVITNMSISYETIDKKLEIKRKHSINFLYEALNQKKL